MAQVLLKVLCKVFLHFKGRSKIQVVAIRFILRVTSLIRIVQEFELLLKRHCTGVWRLIQREDSLIELFKVFGGIHAVEKESLDLLVCILFFGVLVFIDLGELVAAEAFVE